MNYPVLKTKSLPSLYKHCSNVLVLHIDIENCDIGEDAAFTNAYMTYVRNQIYTSIESNFVTSLASRVYSKGETFVIFKSNITKKMLFDFVFSLFAELDQYCDTQMEASLQFTTAMIFQEDTPVKFFKSGKIGKDLQESEELQKSNISYQHDHRTRGKQLYSIKEFRNISEKLPKTISLPKQTEAQHHNTHPQVEELCEYYI